MSDFAKRIESLPPKRLALLAMDLHTKLEMLERAKGEPIAIVGMGCRYPGGVSDLESFWSLLRRGVDAISEVPESRWDMDRYSRPGGPGNSSTRFGGFIDRHDEFDAHFFGIAPREAVSMDPQQRLLLETAWEALENAGRASQRLEGSRTGVFVGVSGIDYGKLLLSRDPAQFDAYAVPGASHAVAAGRISYLLGLQGPCLALDTACSSSLVALHLACRSLRGDECNMALAGGVNLLLTPEVTIALSQANMLAADGRCKTFDSAADGFVRGEGAGVLVLRRLSDAIADGDRILAVIRGSAINQDGRSNGLTAPSGPAQESVIRDALSDAGLEPADVQYVEAHGTGTRLGDPIELQALASVLCADRGANDPLTLGSVKTNFGHLESAAGIAGVMKAVSTLR